MSRKEIADACHEIVDAAASLILDLEFLAKDALDERQEAVDSARRNIDRIVALAGRIRSEA